MGLLDDVIGGIAGGGSNSPIGGLISGLINSQGGVTGLISNFERAGLGGVAQSWVGNGPNQSVSPDQLSRVFGQGQVQSMAQQTGLQPQDFLSQLAQHLPGVVDRMTPNGTVPTGEGGGGAPSTGWDDVQST